MQNSENKKRSHTSPQKTQTSIINYANQKKMNSNPTSPRTAIDRSCKAILDQAIKSPPESLALSNNPYQLLADEGEIEDQDDQRIPKEKTSELMSQGGNSIATNTTQATSESTMTAHSADDNNKASQEVDQEATSHESDSPNRTLLSRKALQALRTIKSLQKALADTSLRAELEEVLGTIDPFLLPDTDSRLPSKEDYTSGPNKSSVDSQPAAKTSKNDEAIYHEEENKQSAENECSPMIIDDDPFSDNNKVRSAETAEKTSSLPSPQATRSVSFAQSVHPLRQGNFSKSSISSPINPYLKQSVSGILHATGPVQSLVQVDKVIALKKNNSRPHIHRYTLRFKTIQAKTEDEGHQIVQDTLQRFFNIITQADPKTVIPPYLELDRNDKSVCDLSSAFPVSSVDSYHAMKKYFFRLSTRDEGGVNWCSIILAQSIPFANFMEKAKYSLENNNFSLWPKVSDNENTTDVGWLLYSTRAQDEDRLSALLSKTINENIGVKWKPIRATTSNVRKKDQTPDEEKVRALHVECSVGRLQEVRDKLKIWYGLSSQKFPDGTKMRLVPTITSVSSINNRTK